MTKEEFEAENILNMRITGKPSGDGESFAFCVSKEQYIAIVGQEEFDRECELQLEYIQDLVKDQEEYGIEDKYDLKGVTLEDIKNDYQDNNWLIYPSQILNKLGIDTPSEEDITLEIKVIKNGKSS